MKGILLPAISVAFLVGAGVGAGGALWLRRRPQPALEETRFLNFDPESTTLQALQSGWSEFERNQQRDTFVWCQSTSCVLAVQAHGQRDRAIRMRTWPFHYPNAPKQEITVSVDETSVARHELGDTSETWEILVPANLWKDGQTLVRFDCAYADRPADHGGGASDTRTLAVAFDWLEIVPQ